jgi:hypothetical protein
MRQYLTVVTFRMSYARAALLRALGCTVLLGAVGGCGEIWGFQTGHLESDDVSAPDATTDVGAAAGDATGERSGDAAGADGPRADASDATVMDAPDVAPQDASVHDAADAADTGAATDTSVITDTASATDATDAEPVDTGSAADTGPVVCPAGSQCAPVAPGWNGPVAMYQGVPGGAATCATSAYSEDVYDGNLGLTAGSATCSPCSCTVATATCSPVIVSVFNSAGCTGSCGTGNASSGQCDSIPNCGLGGVLLGEYATASASTVTDGGCTPTGGAATRPAETWSTTARACALPPDAGTGGCAGSDLCMPNPTLPFKLCVYKSGANSCPPGAYNGSQAVYYTGTTDTRGCEACGCGAISGACSGTVALAGASCGSAAATLTVPNPCTSITAADVGATAALTANGSCPPTQTVPGSIGGDVEDPSTATTVCCLP